MSHEKVLESYGVVVEPGSLTVDADGTEKLRYELQAKRAETLPVFDFGPPGPCEAAVSDAEPAGIPNPRR